MRLQQHYNEVTTTLQQSYLERDTHPITEVRDEKGDESRPLVSGPLGTAADGHDGGSAGENRMEVELGLDDTSLDGGGTGC